MNNALFLQNILLIKNSADAEFFISCLCLTFLVSPLLYRSKESGRAPHRSSLFQKLYRFLSSKVWASRVVYGKRALYLTDSFHIPVWMRKTVQVHLYTEGEAK